MSSRRFLNERASTRKPDALRQLCALQKRMPGDTIALSIGSPNPRTFPFADFKIELKSGEKLSMDAQQLNDALQYQPSSGYPPLVELLKEFQIRFHGLAADYFQHGERDLIVTVGCHDAINKSLEACLQTGDPVVVHVPVFSGVLTDLMAFAPQFIEVPCDEHGMKADQLEEQLSRHVGKKPRLMYINPTGCNPAGYSMTEKRKREIYAVAQRHDLLILEDDPYVYLNFDDQSKSKCTSFLSLDTNNRVVRFDSFSKLMSAGMRVGFMTGPTDLVKAVQLHMQVSVIHSSALSQVVLYQVLKSWQWDGLMEHISDTADFYRQQRDYMIDALNKHMADLAVWNVPKAGMFVWLKLRVADTMTLVEEEAAANGVLVVPGAYFFPGHPAGCSFVRLCYSNCSQQQIDEGVKRLAEATRRFTENGHP